MTLIRWAALIVGLVAGVTASGEPQSIRAFDASYTWRWHGLVVANTTVSLKRENGDWFYRSTSEPRGIGRALSQRPVLESRMQIDADGVRPLQFDSDDGTDSIQRDSHVVFDWERNRATGVYESVPVDLTLSAGTQDDLSIQVALMHELIAGRTPTSFLLIDKNVLLEYRYHREGEAVLDTPIGRERTIIFASQKKGSSRINRFWCAPARGFVPLRIEQFFGKESQWLMQIQSLNRE
jgi:hypothetical protein